MRLATSSDVAFFFRRSIDRKAVEQSRAAGALQSIVAAAFRWMRRIPRQRRRARVESRAVMVADDRRAFSALGPVAAGLVLPCRERGSIRLRTREDVVLIRRRAAVGDDIAFFGQRCLLVVF